MRQRCFSQLTAGSLPSLTKKASDAASSRPLQALPSAPVLKAVSTMARFRVSGLLVQTRGDDELLGMLDHRDVLKKANRGMTSITVQDLMTEEFLVGLANKWQLDRCVRTMLDADQCLLPLIGMGGKVSGMLSLQDVCHALLADVTDGVTPAEPATVSDVVHSAQEERPSTDADERVARDVCHVPSDATVEEAVAHMVERCTTYAIIGEPRADSVEALGVFTSSDLLRALAGKDGADAMMTPISASMRPAADLVSVDAGCPIFDAFARMTQADASHLTIVKPLAANARATTEAEPNSTQTTCEVVGVLSRRELLSFLLANA